MSNTHKYKTYIFAVIIFLSNLSLFLFLNSLIKEPFIDSIDYFFSIDSTHIVNDMISNKISVSFRHPLRGIIDISLSYFLRKLPLPLCSPVLVIDSIVSALSCSILFIIIRKINLSNITAIVVTLLLSFSFSTILYSSVTDCFLFGSLFLMITWLYVISLSNETSITFEFSDLVVISFLGALCFGITITNYIFFWVPILYLLFIKYKKISDYFIVFLKIAVLSTIMILIMYLLQSFCFNTQYNDTGISDSLYFVNVTINMSKILAWIKGSLIYPLISASPILNPNPRYFLEVIFDPGDYTSIALGTVLIALFLSLNIYYIYIMKKNKTLNLLWFSTVVSFIGNILLSFVYGYDTAHLYAPHYLFLLMMIIAMPLDKLINKTRIYKCCILALSTPFILYFLYRNTVNFSRACYLVATKLGIGYYILPCIIEAAPKILIFIAIVTVISTIAVFVLHKTSSIWNVKKLIQWCLAIFAGNILIVSIINLVAKIS